MDAESLQEQFGIPGVLGFDTAAGGLVRANVSAAAAEATIYLQGAHLAHWKPAGEAPVLFLSERSSFVAGKAIRGGVPVIFPWFGERSDGGAGPSHGFARVAEWELAFAAVAGEDVHLTFTLSPTELSKSLGYGSFRLAYAMSIGRELTLQLTVANVGDAPLRYEEALHTYYAVADAREASVGGLEGTEFIDKVDGMRRKRQGDRPIRFTGRRDDVHVGTASTCVVSDPAGGRRIKVAKSGSESTIIWNPWAQLSASLADMADDDWERMVCVETANVGENAVMLAAGEAHTMRLDASVEAGLEVGVAGAREA